MFRKKIMHGCCCLCLGFGVLLGYAMDSWWLSTAGGVALLVLGLLLLKGH